MRHEPINIAAVSPEAAASPDSQDRLRTLAKGRIGATRAGVLPLFAHGKLVERAPMSALQDCRALTDTFRAATAANQRAVVLAKAAALSRNLDRLTASVKRARRLAG